MSKVLIPLSLKTTPVNKSVSSTSAHKVRGSKGTGLRRQERHEFKKRLDELGKGKSVGLERKHKDLTTGGGGLEDKGLAAAGPRKKRLEPSQKKTMVKDKVRGKVKGKVPDEASGGIFASVSKGAGKARKDGLALLQSAFITQSPAQGALEKTTPGLEGESVGAGAVELTSRGPFASEKFPNGGRLQKNVLIHLAVKQGAGKEVINLKGVKKGPATDSDKTFFGKGPFRVSSDEKQGEAGKAWQEDVKSVPSSEVSAKATLPDLSRSAMRAGPGVAALKGTLPPLEKHLKKSLKGVSSKGRVKQSQIRDKASRALLKRGRLSAGVKKITRRENYAVSGGGPSKKAGVLMSDVIKGEGFIQLNVSKALVSLAIGGAAVQGVDTPSTGAGGGGIGDSTAGTTTKAVMGAGLTQARGNLESTATLRHGDTGGHRGGELLKTAANGVVMSLSQRNKEIVIALKPEDLGHMEIKVRIEDGLVETSILVDNPHVLAMINADGASLKELLARQGIMAGGLEVALKDNGNDFSGHKGEFESNGQSRNPGGSGRIQEDDSVGHGMEIPGGQMDESSAHRGLDLFI